MAGARLKVFDKFDINRIFASWIWEKFVVRRNEK
jgi:hypothetical protein